MRLHQLVDTVERWQDLGGGSVAVPERAAAVLKPKANQALMLLPGWTAHTVPHKHCITSSVFRSFSISIYTCIFLVLWDVDLTV